MVTVVELPLAFVLEQVAERIETSNAWPKVQFVVDTAFELGAPVPWARCLLPALPAGLGPRLGPVSISAIAKVLAHLNPKA